MLKIFLRIIVVNIIIGFLVAFMHPFSISKPTGTLDWMLIIWVASSIVTGFFLIGYLFYHWGISKFETNTVKRIWFWIILLGGILYFIGPLAYYIVVYEMGKGLKEKSVIKA